MRKNVSSKFIDKSNDFDSFNEDDHNNENEIDLENESDGLPAREYLEKTVVPVITEALFELSKLKPDNPLEWLGNYLINQSK